MKKRFLAFLLAVIMLCPMIAFAEGNEETLPSIALGSRTMEKGLKGEDVLAAQILDRYIAEHPTR